MNIDKQIIYIKNLLFFKFALTVFIYAICGYLTPGFKTKLNQLDAKLAKARSSFSKMQRRLDLIANSPQTLEYALKEYAENKLTTNFLMSLGDNINPKIRTLQKSIGLKKPISVYVSYINSKPFEHHSYAQIITANISVIFSADTLKKSIAAFEGIYKQLPQNSSILSIEMTINNTIFPEEASMPGSSVLEGDFISIKAKMQSRGIKVVEHALHDGHP